MEDIEKQLKEMIVERLFLNIAPEEIGDDVSLMETYGIDSVRLFEIVIGIEEIFGISLEDNEFKVERFRDINSIVKLIKDKMGDK